MAYTAGMDAEAVIATLRAHRPGPEAMGIAHGGVFGTVGRLDPAVKAHDPQMDRPAIAAGGNVCRHQDQGLRLDVPWRTVQEALPPRLAAVEAECPPRR